MLTLCAGVDAGVAQRLVQRLVGVLQVDVLADEGDVDLVLPDAPARATSLLPRRQVGRAREDRSLWHDDLVEHLLVQHHRDLVDLVDVPGRDHRLLLHVAEQRDLAALVLRQRPVGCGTAATSGWMPISRSSLTECCVGLVLISPAEAM